MHQNFLYRGFTDIFKVSIDEELNNLQKLIYLNTKNYLVKHKDSLTLEEKVNSRELVKRATLLEKGDPAPNFKVTLFDGSSIQLSDLEGHPLVINFWASWCAPCRWEMPEFEESWKAHKQEGIRFAGIATKDVEHESRRFANEVGISYPVGFDPGGKIALSYGVTVLPTTYFVDRDHRIHRGVTGAANAGALSIFLRGITPK